jgi:hypothetical protein
VADDHADRRRQPPQPLVVAGLLRDVREQVAEPLAREAQEAPLGVAAQVDLRDRERDELRVGELWAPPCTAASRQEIVHQHVKCGEQAVKVGAHEATSVVDVAIATPTFDSRVRSPRAVATLTGDSESLI